MGVVQVNLKGILKFDDEIREFFEEKVEVKLNYLLILFYPCVVCLNSFFLITYARNKSRQ